MRSEDVETNNLSCGPKLYILLDQAYLESTKGSGGKEYQLLNPDRHKNHIVRSGIDVSTVRPDIVHQCLLMLLDSPLNRTGRLQIYIRTRKNLIIEVNPKIRIPRTFDRFSGLMVQLLHKLSISAKEGNREKLLKELVKPRDFIREMQNPPKSVVFVIGAMAHGSVIQTCNEFSHRVVSISNFPLSAAQVCTRICDAFEEVWNVEDIVNQNAT